MSTPPPVRESKLLLARLMSAGFFLCLVWKNRNYSRTSTNSHLSAMATLNFIPLDNNSYFNLSTMATSPQQQLPLKRIPSAKVTSPQRPVNQQRTNGVYKTSFFIGHGRETRSVPGVRRWSIFLFGFSLIDIF